MAVQTSLSMDIFVSVSHQRRTGWPRYIVPLSSTVFQVPYEIFQEIFLHLPVLPWTDSVYRRHLCGHEDVWSQPASKTFWVRTRTLLALGATCRMMQQMVLVEAWKVYVVNIPRADPEVIVSKLHEALLSRYRHLLRDPHLAAIVRYIYSVHVSGTSRHRF